MRATWLLPFFAGIAPALVGQGKDDRPDRSVKDPALQSGINGAIYKGIDYLKKIQNADGTWTYSRGGGRGFRGRGAMGSNDETGGLTALVLYALAASGLPPTDPVIEKGVAWCQQNDRPFSEQGRRATYSASLLVLALTRIDAKKHQRWIKRLAGRIAAAQLANAQWNYQLLDAKRTQADRGRTRGGRDQGRGRGGRGGRGGMAMGPQRGDNSNTQFAVLALWAAEAMAKYRTPRKVWKRLEKFFKSTQTKTGEWTYLDPGMTVAQPVGRGGRGRAGGMAQRMMRPKLTMTAAGLCSYVYAHSALRGGVRGLDRARKTKTAVRGLKAFMDQQPQWPYSNYYLVYSIERVGTVLGVPTDKWYVDGARRLIDKQHDDGRWAPPQFGRRGGGGHGDAKQAYETSLALLFLSRATSYPITGVHQGPKR